MNINHLAITWSTSRGRETYGYNICKLQDRWGGKPYRTCGGGYDMIGTVFGAWLADVYQDKLKALVSERSAELVPYAQTGWMKIESLYGLTARKNGTVHLDGACGLESMIRVAEAIGLEVERQGDKKGQLIGFFVACKE